MICWRILLVVALSVATVSCRGPISSDPSTYVGRYNLRNPDPDRSDLPSGVELRSDMSVVQFFGDEHTGVSRSAGRWYVQAYSKNDVDVVFADFGHPVRIQDGEIRLYLNSDLDEYLGKPTK